MSIPAVKSPAALARLLGMTPMELENISATAGSYYKPRLDKAKGKARWLEPSSGVLKGLQSGILTTFLRNYPFPHYVQGSVTSRSTLSNAKVHCGQEEMVRVDIARCFPSITNQMVYRALVRRLHASPPVAALLTPLLTYRGHLPQGCPTSPALANLVLLDVDERIAAAVERAGCTMTRWVDDIVISGRAGAPAALIGAVTSAIRAVGLRVNRRKLTILRRSVRQVVTGYVTNGRLPSVCKRARARARSAVHHAVQSKALDFDVRVAEGLVAYVQTANSAAALVLRAKLRRARRPRKSSARSRDRDETHMLCLEPRARRHPQVLKAIGFPRPTGTS
jgi:hypothetical protein